MSMEQNVVESTHPDAASPRPTGALTRVTANFTPRAMASLDRVSEQTGDSRTDVLNRAVMAYETMLNLIEEGDGRTLRIALPDGEIRVLHFIG